MATNTIIRKESKIDKGIMEFRDAVKKSGEKNVTGKITLSANVKDGGVSATYLTIDKKL